MTGHECISNILDVSRFTSNSDLCFACLNWSHGNRQTPSGRCVTFTMKQEISVP